ncbi:hypothetical protein VIGAN_02315700 [Vigna angularis var. angularis]|uniref:DUF4219 domain-containing protein n=1 Tax=Vigna angularis var. angularis TaxID=157739 RepID=A0A0S3RI10_PHAAN|nr:hypothetical protein VIGAN_02315700 [Vigna angularis var. angularis]
MSNMMSEGQSIWKPPYFNGRKYDEWKERMIVYIKSIDYKLWLVIKNGPTIPTKLVDNEEVQKSEDEYDEEDMKNLELEAKAKNILYCALSPEFFEIFSDTFKVNQANMGWSSKANDRFTNSYKRTVRQYNGLKSGSI